ncbi:kinesin, putative [Trypanosoma brucei brucei TREU927]|uniref:Kinesin, putative n=1 Tax=Trypanosoma brucei brucei (strain 927/4 GUTat10.1) TaxID=185431 RepID=Q57V46_TRYB2|nr:kinesin, putative [Trypanosoma brucei brucei TREU927]AAX70522.1 kinesin, putative [Trypanosoma brucei]AAZ10374.1 kinesin, putative [Trypanosoma brucei brucei TREU927]
MHDSVGTGTRVQVGVRIFPTRQGERSVVHGDPDDNHVVVIDGEGTKGGSALKFDRVFTGSQEEVYDFVGRPMLKEAFEGFNVCLFAYGQTGTGKTYSLFGDLNDKTRCGIAPRFAQAMIEEGQRRMEADNRATIRFSLTMVEVYMEKVRDLLAPRVRGQEPEALEIHEDNQRRVYVKGAGIHPVLSLDRLMELLSIGNANRQKGETKMNETSSRSHAIIQLTISQQHESLETKDVESVAMLVDLAGSERQSKAESTGLAFEEAKKINQSLLMLGRALNSFSDRKGNGGFISLRASKLTRLLSESFGGNSKTWMLATVSPSASNLTETISTLEYAQNASAITNKVRVNRAERRLNFEAIQSRVATLKEQLGCEAKVVSDLDVDIISARDEIQFLQNMLSCRCDFDVEVELREALEEREKLLLHLKSALGQDASSSVHAQPPLSCFYGTCKTSLGSIPLGGSEVETMVVQCYNLSGPPPLLICHVHIHLADENCVAVVVRIREILHLPDYVTGGAQVTMWFEGHSSSSVRTPIVGSNGGNPLFSLKQTYILGPHTKDIERFLRAEVLNFRVDGFILSECV